MTFRRLGMSPANRNKKPALVEIRRLHPDAPLDCSDYDLMLWFCNGFTGQLPAPVPKRERVTFSYQRQQVASDEFLSSFAWRRLRMQVIKERGTRCECCGAVPTDGVTVINVDHIKPRKTHPELSLVKSNLQVLCSLCNHGKGNWDTTDWRQPAAATKE